MTSLFSLLQNSHTNPNEDIRISYLRYFIIAQSFLQKSRLDAIEPLFEHERMHIPSDIIESKLIETFDLLAIGCRKYIDMVQPTITQFVTDLDREKIKLCLREVVSCT